MGGGFVAMKPAAYEHWLQGQSSSGSLAVAGADLYRRLGCGSCLESGSSVRALALTRRYGTEVTLEGWRGAAATDRSDERRGGTECVSTSKPVWWAYH